MSRIRGRDTKPERILRSLLHRAGLRFRKNVSSLPGKPDIVLPKHRVIVLVHGCYWHRHSGCRFATTPATNALFWTKKFAGTVARDRKATEALAHAGWRVLTAWECEIRADPQATAERVMRSIFED